MKKILIGLLVIGLQTGLLSAQEKIRVACLGDSITFGKGIPSLDEKYPAVLGKLLGDAYEVANFGKSAKEMRRKSGLSYWKTDEFKKAEEFQPQIVVIMLGTNDSKNPSPVCLEEFRKDYEEMISHFQNRPSKSQVVICTPPPVAGEGQWGITQENVRNKIVPIVREVALAKQVALADVNEALSPHPDWFPDTVHPNRQGAKKIAETVATVIQSLYFSKK